jgi:hypothetical protein
MALLLKSPQRMIGCPFFNRESHFNARAPFGCSVHLDEGFKY